MFLERFTIDYMKLCLHCANFVFKETDESAVKTSRREKARADAEEMRKVLHHEVLISVKA